MTNPTISVQDMETQEMDEKKRKKQEKQAEKYWNTMISRKEAYEMIDAAMSEHNDRLRLLYIQVKTLTNALVDKGTFTLEELDELSKPVIREIYGELPGEDKKEKDEGTEE